MKLSTKTLNQTILWCVFLSFVGGCLVGPDYVPYEMETPGKWSIADKYMADTEPNFLGWWKQFEDPLLISLVQRAIQSNLNLKTAQSRIRQARAALWFSEGGLWPSVDVAGSQNRSRAPTGAKTELYRTGLDATWELDMFGGQRRDIEAARADVQASVEDLRDVWVTLTSEIALNYISLRGYQQEIVILKQNLTTQQKTAELTRTRFSGGFVGALDVANAETQVANTAAQLPLLELSVQQTIHNLSILLGSEPTALVKELDAAAAIPSAPTGIAVGIPSDLLRRRPDIRRAETQIHAATALIGVAEADLFPKFTLSGSLGFQNQHADKLANWNRRIWSVGPSASWNIFDAGRVRSNIESQKAIQEQYLLAYQQTVLIALQEAQDALIALTKEQEHRDALQKAVDSSRKSVRLATQLYTEGETDFLNVLTAQRSLFSSEDALVNSNRTVSTNLVALYKALGGGWEDQYPENSKK
jgi:NodT family efflux transporter outer membrane factor (OMF) lipoprotein